MRKRKVQDGYIYATDDSIFIENTISEATTYVYVVAEQEHLTPYFILGGYKPISELSEEEEDELIDACNEYYPSFKALRDIQKKHLDGQMTSPCFGLFSIPEVKERSEINRPIYFVRGNNYVRLQRFFKCLHQ